MRLIATLATVAGLAAMAGSALAQEQEDTAATFARIRGGAVYDVRMGVDGTAIAEEFTLTHVVCTDGSKSLRVMLPVSPGDDGTVFSGSGPKSTLKKLGGTYQVVFVAGGQRIRKTLELKPVNDPKSQNQSQFVVRLDYGGPLWNALTSDKPGAAIMLIGQGGMPVQVPTGPKLDAALRSCGISG